MKQTKIAGTVSGLLLLALGLVFLIGSRTFLAACGPKDDGGFMTCHWAGQALTGLAAVLVVIAMLHLIFREPRIRQGLTLASLPVALLAAILPGNLIGLCMMDTMRCQAVMRPGAIALSILWIAAAVFDLLAQKKRID